MHTLVEVVQVGPTSLIRESSLSDMILDGRMSSRQTLIELLQIRRGVHQTQGSHQLLQHKGALDIALEVHRKVGMLALRLLTPLLQTKTNSTFISSSKTWSQNLPKMHMAAQQ